MSRIQGDARLISVSGELDLHTVDPLRVELDNAVEDLAEHVIIDFEDVRFVDSIALGIIANASKRLRGHGGRLAVIAREHEVLRPFQITGLDRVIVIERSLADALQRLTV